MIGRPIFSDVDSKALTSFNSFSCYAVYGFNAVPSVVYLRLHCRACVDDHVPCSTISPCLVSFTRLTVRALIYFCAVGTIFYLI